MRGHEWRRVQKHERRRELERGQHRPDRYWIGIEAMAIDPTTPTTLYAGTMMAAYSKAQTAVETGVRSTPA